MRGFQVICSDCKAEVVHECRSDVREAVVALLTWAPHTGFQTEALAKAFADAGVESQWIGKEEDVSERFRRPFFGSQAWSYPMFGKEEARTFHALIHNLVRAIGIDPNEIEVEIGASLDDAAQARADLLKRRAKQARADLLKRRAERAKAREESEGE